MRSGRPWTSCAPRGRSFTWGRPTSRDGTSPGPRRRPRAARRSGWSASSPCTTSRRERSSWRCSPPARDMASGLSRGARCTGGCSAGCCDARLRVVRVVWGARLRVVRVVRGARLRVVRGSGAGGRSSGGRAAEAFQEMRPQIEAYEAFCDELDEDPAVVALAWLLHQPAVTAPIVGPRTLDQLAGALRALEATLDAKTLGRARRDLPGPGRRGPRSLRLVGAPPPSVTYRCPGQAPPGVPHPGVPHPGVPRPGVPRPGGHASGVRAGSSGSGPSWFGRSGSGPQRGSSRSGPQQRVLGLGPIVIRRSVLLWQHRSSDHDRGFVAGEI